MPLPVTIPDPVGAAPQVSVIDTWYNAPIVPDIDFSSVGGGGGRPQDFEFMMNMELN
jgi:hypothetical protein